MILCSLTYTDVNSGTVAGTVAGTVVGSLLLILLIVVILIIVCYFCLIKKVSCLKAFPVKLVIYRFSEHWNAVSRLV